MHSFLAYKYVSDRRAREASSILVEVIESLIEFLTQRFSADTDRMTLLKPFLNLTSDADLEGVHKFICADLNLETFALEYDELLGLEEVQLNSLQKCSLSQKVKLLAQSEHYKNVTVSLARILAAKPHSADVERLISSCNILKSPGRSSLQIETENFYLFIHHNMPPLCSWDPRPAVVQWLRNKSRRTVDRPKGKEQEYFSGVFAEATAAPPEPDSENKNIAKEKSF